MAIDDQIEFRHAIRRMVDSFGGEIDSPTRKAYARALEGIEVGVIDAALDRLIDEAAGGRKFFPMPKPTDLKGACAKVIEGRRSQAFKLMLAADCQVCHGSRWRSIEVDGVERLSRCACWQTAMKAMESAGKPLSLPARAALGERVDDWSPIVPPEEVA